MIIIIMKKTPSQIKNLVNRINNRLVIADKRVSKLNNRSGKYVKMKHIEKIMKKLPNLAKVTCDTQ